MILIWRVLATIAAINLIVLAVFVGLSVLQFNNIQSGLIRERLVALSDIVRDPFEAVANLGLPLGTVRNANAVLERARLSDEAILAIVVIGANGEIVHSTPAQLEPELKTQALSLRTGLRSSSQWERQTPESFLIGAGITSPTGVEVGSIVIAYSRQDALTQTQAMTAKLVLMSGSILLATILIGFLALRVLLAEHVRIFDGILLTFDTFERRFWRGSGAEVADAPEISGLGLRSSEFRDLIERSEAQYRKAEAVTPQADP